MDKKKAQIVLGVVVLTVLVFVGGIFAGRSFATNMSSDEQKKADTIARAAEEPERPFTDETERQRLNIWKKSEALQRFDSISSELSIDEAEQILGQRFEDDIQQQKKNEEDFEREYGDRIAGPIGPVTGPSFNAKYGSRFAEDYGVGSAIKVSYRNGKVNSLTLVPGFDERIKFYTDVKSYDANKGVE